MFTTPKLFASIFIGNLESSSFYKLFASKNVVELLSLVFPLLDAEPDYDANYYEHEDDRACNDAGNIVAIYIHDY